MRYALSDSEWGTIQPILPTKSRGVPRVDGRRVLNGIFWVLRSGVRHGVICRTATVPIRPATIASTAGARRASGIRYWRVGGLLSFVITGLPFVLTGSPFVITGPPFVITGLDPVIHAA